MEVVFLGNHDVGIYALNALREIASVTGIVAHPDDPEDGRVYKSVYEYGRRNNIPVIRGRAKDKLVYNFIAQRSPDLIWVTDYRYIIPQTVINLAQHGAVNLHPSLLPAYKGRAPINWAIINGENELGLTAHYIDTGIDSGDIIEQYKFSINSNWYIGDVLKKYYALYYEITKKVALYFKHGNVPRKKQSFGEYPVYPARKPQDGLINWQDDPVRIYNLIRAVSKPYPGAFTFLENQKLIIWQADLKKSTAQHIPGTVLSVHDHFITIACNNNFNIVAKDWEFSARNVGISIGAQCSPNSEI